MLALVVVALAVVFTVVNQSSPNNEMAYTDFLSSVSKGQVQDVTQEGSTLTVKPTTGSSYTVVVPGLLANQVLTDMQQAVGPGKPTPKFGAKQAPDNGWISILITGLLPILIIGGVIFFFMRQAPGTKKQAPSFCKTPAPRFLRNKTAVAFAGGAGGGGAT